MKNSEMYLLVAIGLIAIGLLFWGMIAGIRKTFIPQPQIQTINPSDILKEQKKRSEEIKEQQKKLMDDYKQRMRDYQTKSP